MPNPDGTHTREEHRAAIMDLYLKNREAGMSEDAAMFAAGTEWRRRIKAAGERKITLVTEWLKKGRPADA